MISGPDFAEQATRFGRNAHAFDQRCRQVTQQYAEAYRASLRGDDVDLEWWQEWYCGWVEYLMYLSEHSSIADDHA